MMKQLDLQKVDKELILTLFLYVIFVLLLKIYYNYKGDLNETEG